MQNPQQSLDVDMAADVHPITTISPEDLQADSNSKETLPAQIFRVENVEGLFSELRT